MPTTTTNYGLHIFNNTTDKLETFELFREYLAGIGTNSNMYIIDGKLKEWKDLIDALDSRQAVVRVPMAYQGGTLYTATGISGISVSYPIGMTVAVIPDITNAGTSQLNINSLGAVTMVKINSSGVVTNLAAGDLVIDHVYLFIYDGTNLVWVGATSSDQIHTVGTASNFVSISSSNTLEDSTISLDTDIALTSNSDSKIASQKATKTYVDSLIDAANALVYKGVIDCSTNPDYPAANAGWMYIVSVAGKIGGVSGENVEVGDMIICKTDGTVSGNQATVGIYWSIIQKNIDGAVTGAPSSVDEALAVFDGASGKVIKNGASPGAIGNILESNGTAWVSVVASFLSLATAQTVTGAKTFGTIGGAVGKLILAGSTSGSTILNASAVAGATTVVLPSISDTLVGLTTTDTLTNKTLTSPKINENVVLTTTATRLNYLASVAGTTGTISTNLVFSTSPTLVTPTLGVATATSINKVAFTAPTTAATFAFGTDNTTQTFQGTDTIVGRATTDTLTNKRITKRVSTEASNATPTPNADSYDMHTITALAVAPTFGAPTGTPTQGQQLMIRIKDNGTARALLWNAIYRAMGVTLPTTTVLGKTLYLGFIYNSTDVKWDLVASAQEA